jgi:DsbC/DsbD-like thiol-disulfide interchange protein
MQSYRSWPNLAAAAAVLLALAGVARADAASAWSSDISSAIRLIAGAGNGTLRHAGIEMKLQPGWHTYWRYPGDSGVPPQFDFSGSDNLKTAKVLYPAPQLHKDEAGETIGYAGDVVFPVEVTAKDPSRPVQLHVSVDYAVCEKMCVPAKGTASLALAPGAPPNPTLQAALARVPEKVSASAAGLNVKRSGTGAKPTVTIDLPAPASGPVSVFVEGPTASWALPIPKPAAQAPAGKRAFTFALDGLPPGADPAKPIDLTVTVVEGARAFEVTTRLD